MLRDANGLSQLSRRSDYVASLPLSKISGKGSLSRAYRLHHRWEFLRFFKNAELFRFSECLIFRIPNDQSHFRLGITFKTKASSVERNRVKRTIRESFRLLGPGLGAFDYNVVIPRGKKLLFPYSEKLRVRLTTEFCRALSRR